MPAVERQLVECVRHVIKGSEPTRVGVVSSQEDQNNALIEQFGPGATATTCKDITSLEKLSDLNVLVVNQALEKELHDSQALDKFISGALRSLRVDGVLIVRQDLCSPKLAGLYLDSHKEAFPKTSEWNCFIPVLDFLDRTQYTDTGIFAYEWIFGDNFISPGGWDQNLAILKRFGPMKTGQTMLDIGVGIGGGARQAASEFGLHVLGVDLSTNMLAVALDRVHKEKDARVTYAVCDAVEYDFDPNSFDYVFSRDCIQHIKDTEKLFSRIFRALKPGGKVLITMYGVGHGKLSEQFKEYVSQRQYYLKNLEQIEEIAKKVGFIDIETENMTPRFKEILLEERQRVEQNKEEFLEKFSQKEYDSLVKGWSSKLQYIADDNHNWNFFAAIKPH
ncbi:methyltransferase domain protein [Teladorsagia circumcincta]|uniref:phosphoethanolamine N-methyltransferase n=1 Tax=Teladorsagia circumcincta TaxID=45464 RepID=A0A2G9U3C8_TELCI|nr:methyltransferase domain protein [Teladorsagia circumcincta]